jgi:fucose 4-O-acetylase-like acetyltransferase
MGKYGGMPILTEGVEQFVRGNPGRGDLGDAPAIEGERAIVHPADAPGPDVRRSLGVDRHFDAAFSLTRLDGPAAAQTAGARSSLALRNLRALAILTLVAFHSVIPYLWSTKSIALPFDQPPYQWRAFPIVDSQRWFGFDLFCAWQDVYLMALMFFLSGLFAWPSLVRKGSGKFMSDRFTRLGVPFVFGLIVIVPFGLYPAYRVVAVDPSVLSFGRSFLALPFWPNGPLWFLWLLLAFTIALAGLHRVAPRSVALLGRLSSGAGARPGRYFMGLTSIAAVAYVPLALAFTPWSWSLQGPFTLQLSRPLLYGVYYFAGIGVGVHGLERGLLANEGKLARRWSLWLISAIASLSLWMGLTGLTLNYADSAPWLLQSAADASFAWAGASGLFFAAAVCLRFGASRSRFFEPLSKNSLGIYLLHYAPLVWLEYAMLDVPLSAGAKAAIVFGGTAGLSYAATSAMRFVPLGARLIGEEPRTPHAARS